MSTMGNNNGKDNNGKHVKNGYVSRLWEEDVHKKCLSKLSGAAARTGEFKQKRKKGIIRKWGKKLPLKTGNRQREDYNLAIYNKIHGKSG